MYFQRTLRLGPTRLQSVSYGTIARRTTGSTVLVVPATHARLYIAWRETDAVVLEVLPAEQRRRYFGGDWWNSEPEGTSSEHYQSPAVTLTTTTSIATT